MKERERISKKERRFLREKWQMSRDPYDVLKGAGFQCIMPTKCMLLNQV